MSNKFALKIGTGKTTITVTDDSRMKCDRRRAKPDLIRLETIQPESIMVEMEYIKGNKLISQWVDIGEIAEAWRKAQ